MSIKIITLMIFIISLAKTVELISIHLSKNRALTQTGYKLLGVFAMLLIISGVQLFNIFDFIGYITK